MHTVMIVEDHASFRAYISRLLQKNSELRLVSAVADGQEAVTQIQEHKPDLIILDLGLPRMNGFEVIRRIRSLDFQPIILVLSADASADLIEEAFALGAFGYVLKSDGFELLAGITSVLEGRMFLSSQVAQKAKASMK